MKVFLAGGEANEQFSTILALTGHKNQLMSYFHFKKNSQKSKEYIINNANLNKINMIIDSGLFTMMFGAGKGKFYNLPFMKDYTDEYIESVKKYGLNNYTVVESDVHKILGMDAVFTLREKFEKSGLDVIYVWHMEEGIDGLIKMSNKYKCIAISVPELRIVFKNNKLKYQNGVYDLIRKIKDETKTIPKIHLLGNTVQSLMENNITYSCDSTSWCSGVRYGNSLFFKDGKIKKTHIRSELFRQIKETIREKEPHVIESIKNMTKTIKYSEYLLNLYVSAKGFAKYQEWLNSHYTWIGEKNGKENNR